MKARGDTFKGRAAGSLLACLNQAAKRMFDSVLWGITSPEPEAEGGMTAYDPIYTLDDRLDAERPFQDRKGRKNGRPTRGGSNVQADNTQQKKMVDH